MTLKQDSGIIVPHFSDRIQPDMVDQKLLEEWCETAGGLNLYDSLSVATAKKTAELKQKYPDLQIAVQYSPLDYYPGKADPNTQAFYKNMAKFYTYLDLSKNRLDNVGLCPDAIILDVEKLSHSRSQLNSVEPNSEDSMRSALNHIGNLVHEMFPAVKIIWYGRGIQAYPKGLKTFSPGVREWALTDYWTGKEYMKDSFVSPSIYNICEGTHSLWGPQLTLAYNNDLAKKMGLHVAAFMCFGCGYQSFKWYNSLNYPLEYDTAMGTLIKNTKNVRAVCVYYGPFRKGCPFFWEHFRKYCKGWKS